MSSLFKVNNTFYGFSQLINLYENNRESWFETINIDIENFFAANMCSPLAAILDKLIDNLNTITLNVRGDVRNILQRNGFLSEYGYENVFDEQETTIPYRKFAPTESKEFAVYVLKKLLERNDMPHMSDKLKTHTLIAISEIFSNASVHTNTPYVYACGQFYPKKKLLDFTLSDQGEGIREKVSDFLAKPLSSEEAIRWAMVDGNTTKKNIPGGYGLTILRSLIEYNKGFMQIVSDDGFYQFSHEKEIFKTFESKFPGTVVNLQFRTDDASSYYLKSERKESI
jgi:hypothetical protein